MTREQDFEKKAKFKHKHCSSLSLSPWCDLNSNGSLLKLQDKWPISKCNCQKQVTFTSKQIQQKLVDIKFIGENFSRN